jgi:hypothetical protein
MPVFKSIQNSPETVAIALSGNYNRKRGGSNDYRHPVEDKHCKRCKSFDKYAKPRGFSKLYNHNRNSIKQELI